MNEKEMIEEFIESLNISDVVFLIDYNNFYKTYFSATKNIYLKIINSSLGSEFSVDFAKQYNKLRNDILEIYRYYVKGDILRASTKMNNILFRREYYGKKFFEYFIHNSNNEILYRCRQADKNEAKFISENIHDQMFHIAFNKRNLIGNCRFSISGFPCLYLGSSIECCIKEIDWNKDNELVTCEYYSKEKFKLYDLTLDKNILDISELKIFLLKYLIVQAVSYTVNPIVENKDNVLASFNTKKFLTYYVIPQLITAAIASRGEKTKETQCIRYHSVKFPDDSKQYNYVFIPRIINYRINKYYDENLYNKFEIKLYEDIKENMLVKV